MLLGLGSRAARVQSRPGVAPGDRLERKVPRMPGAGGLLALLSQSFRHEAW